MIIVFVEMKAKLVPAEQSEETKQVEGWFQCILWQDLNSRLGEWQWDLVRLDPHSKATELFSNRFKYITSFPLTLRDSWEVNSLGDYERHVKNCNYLEIFLII